MATEFSQIGQFLPKNLAKIQSKIAGKTLTVGKNSSIITSVGPVAHAWLEQRTHNPLVVSSTLTRPTILIHSMLIVVNRRAVDIDCGDAAGAFRLGAAVDHG